LIFLILITDFELQILNSKLHHPQLCTAKVLTMAVSTVMIKLITVFQVSFFVFDIIVIVFIKPVG